MSEKRKGIPITDTGEDLTFGRDPRTGQRIGFYFPPENVDVPRGRPAEKDWMGMMHWLVAKVGKEGLPQGRGAKMRVAEWISQWFINRDQEATMSSIQDRVRLIYEQAEGLSTDNRGE